MNNANSSYLRRLNSHPLTILPRQFSSLQSIYLTNPPLKFNLNSFNITSKDLAWSQLWYITTYLLFCYFNYLIRLMTYFVFLNHIQIWLYKSLYSILIWLYGITTCYSPDNYITRILHIFLSLLCVLLCLNIYLDLDLLVIFHFQKRLDLHTVLSWY